MVYPILKFNQDDSTEIQILDSSFISPIVTLEMNSTLDNIIVFMDILQAFVNQYGYGYDNGWEDGERFAEEEQDWDC